MTKAFAYALRLLTGREQGEYELREKLAKKEYSEEEINKAIGECQRLNLQNDARFAESLCRTRIRQGCGPLKIRYELQQKCIAFGLIEEVLRQEQDNWASYALDVLHKKYKKPAASMIELQKQQRFLLYRGFPSDIIRQVCRLDAKVQESSDL